MSVKCYKNMINNMLVIGSCSGEYLSDPGMIVQGPEGVLVVSLSPFNSPEKKDIRKSTNPLFVGDKNWLEILDVPNEILQQYQEVTSGIVLAGANTLNNLADFSSRK